jgi:hypothetical protein
MGLPPTFAALLILPPKPAARIHSVAFVHPPHLSQKCPIFRASCALKAQRKIHTISPQVPVYCATSCPFYLQLSFRCTISGPLSPSEKKSSYFHFLFFIVYIFFCDWFLLFLHTGLLSSSSKATVARTTVPQRKSFQDAPSSPLSQSSPHTYSGKGSGTLKAASIEYKFLGSFFFCFIFPPLDRTISDLAYLMLSDISCVLFSSLFICFFIYFLRVAQLYILIPRFCQRH